MEAFFLNSVVEFFKIQRYRDILFQSAILFRIIVKKERAFHPLQNYRSCL